MLICPAIGRHRSDSVPPPSHDRHSAGNILSEAMRPALREVFGSLGPVIAEICGAGSGSIPTDLRVLLPSWSGVIC